MRLLLFLILFPVFLFAQELPDSAIAAKLGVKKLVISRCENDSIIDIVGSYIFNNGWENEMCVFAINIKNEKSDSNAIFIQDESGHVIWDAQKKHRSVNGMDIVDTIGYHRKYNFIGQLTEIRMINTHGNGTVFNYLYYDSIGNLKLKIASSSTIEIAVNRTEYLYNREGKLHSILEWKAVEPEEYNRMREDIIVSRIEYRYDLNGLILQMNAYDPMHRSYCMAIPKSKNSKCYIPSENLVYRYTYQFN